jgi:2-oxoglutarate dehydrogenase E1 component
MLRRQMLRNLRTPLIVMTPKSLLRHKMSVSPVSELSSGEFAVIIPETDKIEVAATRRVVFCSGKVYFDLLEARKQHEIHHVALIRLEQIYPFPVDQYAAVLAQYPHVNEFVWCQEEPQNQGAWYQIRHRLQESLMDEQQLYYAGRQSAAAPASGIYKVHLQQQQALVEAALGIETKASKSAKPRKVKKK